ANTAVAVWCAEQGLAPEAELFHWRAALADWSAAGPHEALAHRLKRDQWEVRFGRDWLDLDELRDATKDFGTPFTIRTSLHEVRTNASLEDGVEAAVGLIRVYHWFHHEFGPHAPLRHATEVMELYLHGDAASYPESSTTLPGDFLVEDNRIVMDALRWRGLPDLAHQAGHQLLYAAYQDYRRGVGLAPAWLAESVSEYLARMLDRDGPPDASLAAQQGNEYFRVHAEAREPHGITRVLNFDMSDVHRPGDDPLRVAQSYTLLYFLLHADEKAYADRFRVYFAGTFEGKSSPTDFDNALELDDGELEERWARFVAEAVSGG
ncbi:MAG TPA: hypothetical protein VJP77_02200, partial [Planctomycetota bacterium]|nr:hypothetical protein [Planctomycetota bacterium]